MQVNNEDVEFDRVSMISQASTAIAGMPKRDIQEVKTFAAPPQAVKDVLTATLLLLGRPMTKDPWSECRKMLSNPAALLKEIADCDHEKIPVATRKKAMSYLSDHTTDSIKSKSSAIAAFYDWAIAVASE